MDDDQMALVAKALAHPARIRIVRLLAQQSECMGNELFSDLPLAQSTVSEHLAVLKRAGVVSSHHVGVAGVYCLNPDTVRDFCADLSAIVAQTPLCSPETKECR